MGPTRGHCNEIFSDFFEMPEQSSPVDDLLKSLNEGDRKSLDDIFALVYNELHRLAKKVKQGNSANTVNTTALIHEAYLKLAGKGNWENKLHFMRTAAKAMRHILISQARQKVALKRGGENIDITFEEEVHHTENVSAEDMLSINEAIIALEKVDLRLAQVVEYRYFAGLSVEDTAGLLGVSERTIKRDWRTARAFLASELKS